MFSSGWLADLGLRERLRLGTWIQGLSVDSAVGGFGS